MMTLPADPWLWILDDELVRSLLAAVPGHAGLKARAAAHPALAESMRHWLKAEPSAALAALEPALAAEDPDALLLGAQICFESGDADRAAALYHRLAAAAPDHPYASFNEGLCRAKLGSWPEAVQALQRAVVLMPSHAEAWHLLGVSLLHVDRPAEAASAFAQCLNLRPGYVPALCGQAASLQLLNKPAEALAVYLPLLESAPGREELLANALQAALAAEDWPNVRRLATRMGVVSPGSPAAREALARADFQEQRYESALAAWQELAAAAPALLEHWYHIGLCQYYLGRYREAAEAFQAALQIDPRHAEARLALAEALFMAGDPEPARAAFEALGEAAGTPPLAWLRLGMIHVAQGRTAQALEALEKARQLGVAPDDPVLAELKAGIAVRLHEQGDYGRAADLYALALAVKPDEARWLFNYGHALASLERLAEAQQAWKAALALEPELAPELVASLEPRPVRSHAAQPAG